jgi:hypothetical protein
MSSAIKASFSGSGLTWLRPWIAPLAMMVAAAPSALPGRVFHMLPRARSSRWRIVERRAFKQAGGIVGVRPCGRGEDKGDEASTSKHAR